MTHIEFGNETNYAYQNGDANSPAYAAVAQTYASRFKTCKDAIVATGMDVELLCQGMPADSQSPNWINNMFISVPSLASLADGWTIHPYGPQYLTKLQNCIGQLAAKAAVAPIDITEIGVTTDNGATLSDNYGWPTNLTYAQAATTMQTVKDAIRTHPTIGPRVRHFMVYQAHDQQPSGTGQREHYFGGLKNTLAEKGPYSTTVRNILASS